MAEFWTILGQIVDPALRPPGADAAAGLTVCRHCGAEALVPLFGQHRQGGPARMLLRCGNCGRRRAAYVTAADRVRLERTLRRGRAEIARSLRELEAGGLDAALSPEAVSAGARRGGRSAGRSLAWRMP